MQKGIKGSLCGMVLLLAAVILVGCSVKSGDGKHRTRIVASKGLPSELLMVVDRQVWESDLADSLKDLAEGTVPGLAQSEAFFRLTRILTPYYKQPYTTMHSKLFVHLDSGLKQTMLGVSYDVIARPQIEVTVKAPNLADLRQFLCLHKDQIRDVLNDAQLQMRADQLRKKHNDKVSRDLKSTLGMSICAPEQLRATKRRKNFLWAGTNLNEKDQNLVVYTYPWDGTDVMTPWYFAEMRDSVMQQNIPGSRADQWMQTTRGEAGVPVVLSRVRTLNGQRVQEVRGLWEMRNGALGGPFVSYVQVDSVKRQVIVSEGFVYSPSTEKRDLLRAVEASLLTLKTGQR